jgi:FlaA1/EpsC-like NDP-sugar epimerase
MNKQIFQERMSAAILILLVADGLVLLTSLYYGVALRYAIVDPLEYSEVIPLYPRAAVYTLIMLAAFAVMGMYAQTARREATKYYVRFASAFVIGTLLMLIAGHFVQPLFLPRGAILLTALLACALTAGARLVLQRYVFDRGVFSRPG